MIKINYPQDRADLHDKYISTFNINQDTRDKYVDFRRRLPNSNIIPNSIDALLTADFVNLCQYSFDIMNIDRHYHRWLRKFFNYGKYQPAIAEFFMLNTDSIKLTSCYYCNIDFVNSFKDISDYHNGLDFVKHASINELLKIREVGPSTCNKIIAQRNNINDLDELRIPIAAKNNLKNLVLKEKHNHFTLDHVLNKEAHPIIAISLYNFVPCCYSCNSKFKKDIPVIENVATSYLSPTSHNFNFDNDVKFEILFRINQIKILDITSVNDFVLEFNISNHNTEYGNYIKLLKLRGRYNFHKQEVVKLITKAKRYSPSQIIEISKTIGIAPQKVKEDIFGTELFENDLEDTPLTKLKRDIAAKIGVLV